MSISVIILAGTSFALSNVTTQGNMQHIIDEAEKINFKVANSDELTTACGKMTGRKPNDIYLISPTPWGDLFRTYNWPQTETVIKVKSAEITSISTQPEIIKTQSFKNQSKIPGTFNVSISDQVTNSTQSTWNNSQFVNFNQSINYGISFLGSGISGSSSFFYNNTWGQSKSESTNYTIGSTSGVTVVLQPGETVTSILSASRSKMNVQIVYEASLRGNVALSYDPPFNKHHFYVLKTAEIMKTANIPNNTQSIKNVPHIVFFVEKIRWI